MNSHSSPSQADDSVEIIIYDNGIQPVEKSSKLWKTNFIKNSYV
jgi:hypothetical protein